MLNCSTVSQLLFSTMPYKKVPKYSISTSIRNYSTTTDFQLFHLNNGILNCSVFNIFYQLFCLNVVQYSILTTVRCLHSSVLQLHVLPVNICMPTIFFADLSSSTICFQLLPEDHFLSYMMYIVQYQLFNIFVSYQLFRLYYCAPFKLFKSCTGAHGAFTVHTFRHKYICIYYSVYFIYIHKYAYI